MVFKQSFINHPPCFGLGGGGFINQDATLRCSIPQTDIKETERNALEFTKLRWKIKAWSLFQNVCLDATMMPPCPIRTRINACELSPQWVGCLLVSCAAICRWGKPSVGSWHLCCLRLGPSPHEFEKSFCARSYRWIYGPSAVSQEMLQGWKVFWKDRLTLTRSLIAPPLVSWQSDVSGWECETRWSCSGMNRPTGATGARCVCCCDRMGEGKDDQSMHICQLLELGCFNWRKDIKDRNHGNFPKTNPFIPKDSSLSKPRSIGHFYICLLLVSTLLKHLVWKIWMPFLSF